jgi:hypothetical protein
MNFFKKVLSSANNRPLIDGRFCGLGLFGCKYMSIALRQCERYNSALDSDFDDGINGYRLVRCDKCKVS